MEISQFIMSKPSPLRILCLHGYRQSEKIFRQRTGSLRKILKNKAELVYMTAPNLVLTQSEENVEDQYGWWFSSKDRSYLAQDYTDTCPGYDESIEKIAQFIKADGPFDGILAFSQGAALLSLLCGLMAEQENRFPCKFVILIAGFKSRQSQHKDIYKEVFNVPSLHVIGDTDQVIQRDMSDELLKNFSNPEVIRHPGGHFIPTSPPQKKVYLEFLSKFQQ